MVYSRFQRSANLRFLEEIYEINLQTIVSLIYCKINGCIRTNRRVFRSGGSGGEFHGMGLRCPEISVF